MGQSKAKHSPASPSCPACSAGPPQMLKRHAEYPCNEVTAERWLHHRCARPAACHRGSGRPRRPGGSWLLSACPVSVFPASCCGAPVPREMTACNCSASAAHRLRSQIAFAQVPAIDPDSRQRLENFFRFFAYYLVVGQVCAPWRGQNCSAAPPGPSDQSHTSSKCTLLARGRVVV